MGGDRLRRRRFLGGLAVSPLTLLSGCRCTSHPEPPSPGRAAPSTTPRAPASAAATPTRPLRVLTYNVLADPLRVEERIPPLMAVLEKADADIIALQEVAPWFMQLLHQQPWVGAYQESTMDGIRAYPGGQYILSRHPIQSCWAEVLPGRQRRTALYADIHVGDTNIRVATTHMESYLEDGPVRGAQLRKIFAKLRDAEHALFLGDFNFGDGEPEASRLESSYEDLWLALHSGDRGFTWDIERSELARESSFPGEPSRRLDRVLLRSNAWRGAAISIVGDQPVVPGKRDLFPSDHFGLVAELVRAGRDT
jgi:tyrosyl-DNA phosphodiesterase 2